MQGRAMSPLSPSNVAQALRKLLVAEPAGGKN